jgi:hypothetical protein
MRVILTIDDDLLVAARAIAKCKKRSVGEIISELARRSLHEALVPSERNGIPLLPPRPVTLKIVNALRDR